MFCLPISIQALYDYKFFRKKQHTSGMPISIQALYDYKC